MSSWVITTVQFKLLPRRLTILPVWIGRNYQKILKRTGPSILFGAEIISHVFLITWDKYESRNSHEHPKRNDTTATGFNKNYDYE